ncbi:MAG: hypothetical protein RLZZ381_2481 [Cyanobacteriota bacterium]|jgi:hypothetical protein
MYNRGIIICARRLLIIVSKDGEGLTSTTISSKARIFSRSRDEDYVMLDAFE